MLPPSFLGVGPQGFDQKGMGREHCSTLHSGAGGAQDWGKCLAEELLSLKGSSHLEKPGCCLHRLLAVSCIVERQAVLQPLHAFPPERRSEEFPWWWHGLGRVWTGPPCHTVAALLSFPLGLPGCRYSTQRVGRGRCLPTPSPDPS